jgi:DNA-binding SARP family transcriptional activator
MARLTISLLGGFRVACEGRSRPALTRKKSQALLALLALRPGTGYARDTLTALLWSDSSDEQARHSLRQELHELRRALAPTRTRALLVDAERIALDAQAVEVDVLRFERLAADGTPEALKRAADLYQGDLLAGVGVRETAFEDHLRAERERLQHKALGVLTRLLEHQTKRNLLDRAASARPGCDPGTRAPGAHDAPRASRTPCDRPAPVPGVRRGAPAGAGG